MGQYSQNNGNNGGVDRAISLSAKAILVLTIVTLLLPIAASFAIYGSVFAALDKMFLGVTDAGEARIRNANIKDGITTNFELADLKQLEQRLQSITAPSSEAKLAERLHIIVVNNDKTAQKGSAQEKVTFDTTASRAVEVDISEVNKTAFVVVTNRPTVFNFPQVRENQRALFGYEGKEAFDINGAENGLLAGYLSEALTFFSSADVKDFELVVSSKKKSKNYKACKTIKRWQEYFEVDRDSTYIWTVRNSEDLKIRKYNIVNNGLRVSRSKAFKDYCVR